MSRPDIRPDHFKIVQDILNKSLSSDVKVWVYGSRAKWTTLDSSDLDLALESKDKIDDKIIAQLKRDFEESNLPYEVDVVDIADVQSFFKDIINKDKVLLDRYTSIKEKKLIPKGWQEVKLVNVIFLNPLESIPKETIRKKVLMDDLAPFRKRISNYNNDTYKGGSKFRNGDTLLARITPCLENGKTVFVDILEEDEIGFGSTEFIVMRNKPHLTDKHFLFYLSISPYFRDLAIKSMTGSSGRQRVQINDIMNIKVLLPLLPEQKAIANILSSLDDKIEQNQSMNRVLEGMAQAIFKSWFVNFDPVHAKKMALEAGLSKKRAERAAIAVIAGVCSPKQFAENFKQMDRKLDKRLSQMSQKRKEELAHTASLFPSEFIDSHLGPIPNGWNICKVGEKIDFNPITVLKKGTIANYVDMKSLPTSGHRIKQFVKRIFTSGTKFQNGDTLMARITPCLENGKTAYVDCLEDKEVAWGSTEFIVMRPRKDVFSIWIYLLSRNDDFRRFAISNMSGTSGRQRVSADVLFQYKISFANIELLNNFNKVTTSFFEKIRTNSIENVYLETCRDTLLPKLLSGEINISKLKTKEKV